MAGRELLLNFDRNRDPALNLRREEEIFERVDAGRLPEIARFWVNDRCLVRGKARSANYGWYREDLAEKMGIPVFQRSTGGGVVYHDPGNLNWSLFLRTSGSFISPRAAFESASKYVIKALSAFGVPAQFAPPNRIDAEGRKISGMAARSTVRTLLVHGTLLLNSDLDTLNLLCIPPASSPPVSNLKEWAKDIEAGRVIDEVVEVLNGSGFDVRRVESSASYLIFDSGKGDAP